MWIPVHIGMKVLYVLNIFLFADSPQIQLYVAIVSQITNIVFLVSV